MRMKDEELIQAFQNGSEEAFNELYHRYEKRMYDLAFRMSHSDADAKDAVQETFLSIHRSISSLREPKYFSLWIRKILLSKIKQIFAKNKTLTIPEDDYRMISQEEDHIEFLPIKQMHYTNDQLQLQDFVDQLPFHYREVLILTYFDGLKNQEIADILSVPVGTIKSRLSMARNILKTQIETYEKQNHVKLDFKEDVLIGAISTKGLWYLTKPSLRNGSTVFMQGGMSSIIKAIACVAFLAGGTMTAIKVVKDIQQEHPQKPLYKETMQEKQPVVHTINFTPVTVDEITYETPYQAYQGLKKYLHCEYEMKHTSQEELAHLQALYDSLKQENGTYYQLLKKQGWIEDFEKLSNHS